MRFTVILFTLQLMVISASGQIDPQAVKILDIFSSTATDAPSVSMKFLMITSDQLENTRDTINGEVILSKNKYMLELPDNIVWYDGKTSWNLLPVEKEITITEPDRKDDSFQTNPSSIFTMYKEGFKCRLVEEKARHYIIDLYPENINNDDLIRVRLTIEKKTHYLDNFEYKRRDGITIDFKITEYNLTVVPGQDTFIYKESEHKGVEVIDMR